MMTGTDSGQTMEAVQRDCDALAAAVLEAAGERGLKIAAAESLTGGLLADAFVRIPGASEVFLGSAVTYDIHAKASVLGVDADLLQSHGAVDPEVARQMAERTAELYDQPQYGGRVIGLSTTGVAGPGPDGDKPAGLVFIGVSMPPMYDGDGRTTTAYKLRLGGSRAEVRQKTIEELLQKVRQLTLLKAE